MMKLLFYQEIISTTLPLPYQPTHPSHRSATYANISYPVKPLNNQAHASAVTQKPSRLNSPKPESAKHVNSSGSSQTTRWKPEWKQPSKTLIAQN